MIVKKGKRKVKTMSIQRPRGCFAWLPDASSIDMRVHAHSHYFLLAEQNKYTNFLANLGRRKIMIMMTKILCRKHGGAAVVFHRSRRWLVGKASNRAAVHGSKLPIPDTAPVEKVVNEIKGAVEERETKRREIENSVDSHLKNWQVLYVDQIVSSK